MPWMRIAASAGSGTPFCLLLNGELWTTTAAPAARWPRSEPRGASASACGSRNVPVASTTRATPLLAPRDVLGVARLAQEEDLLAVGADDALLLVQHRHVARARAAEEEAVQRPVGGVLGEVLDDGLERGAHRAARVDHEAVEVVASEVVPQRELADAADAVDAQGALCGHPCAYLLSRRGPPRRTGLSVAARLVRTRQSYPKPPGAQGIIEPVKSSSVPFDSEALRANLANTAQEVVIPDRYLPLLEAVDGLHGVRAALAETMGEYFHTFRNATLLVDGFQTTLLRNWSYFERSPRPRRAVRPARRARRRPARLAAHAGPVLAAAAGVAHLVPRTRWRVATPASTTSALAGLAGALARPAARTRGRVPRARHAGAQPHRSARRERPELAGPSSGAVPRAPRRGLPPHARPSRRARLGALRRASASPTPAPSPASSPSSPGAA